jgi:hypothetical protein
MTDAACGEPRGRPLEPPGGCTPNASAQGVTIQAEAVVNDAHTLYLIVEVGRRDRAEG